MKTTALLLIYSPAGKLLSPNLSEGFLFFLVNNFVSSNWKTKHYFSA